MDKHSFDNWRKTVFLDCLQDLETSSFFPFIQGMMPHPFSQEEYVLSASFIMVPNHITGLLIPAWWDLEFTALLSPIMLVDPITIAQHRLFLLYRPTVADWIDTRCLCVGSRLSWLIGHFWKRNRTRSNFKPNEKVWKGVSYGYLTKYIKSEWF